MTLNGLLTALIWLGIAVAGWLAIAFIVGVVLGRGFRGRDHHYPSPNHPAMRARKQLATERPPTPARPLTPRETAALDQLREQLR